MNRGVNQVQPSRKEEKRRCSQSIDDSEAWKRRSSGRSGVGEIRDCRPTSGNIEFRAKRSEEVRAVCLILLQEISRPCALLPASPPSSLRRGFVPLYLHPLLPGFAPFPLFLKSTSPFPPNLERTSPRLSLPRNPRPSLLPRQPWITTATTPSSTTSSSKYVAPTIPVSSLY